MEKNGKKNPYIESMNEDVLYHIGLSSGSQDLKAMFGDIKVCKVRTFCETHKVWKNLPHGFDKSADLLSKRQNHEEDFFRIMCAYQKVRSLLNDTCSCLQL